MSPNEQKSSPCRYDDRISFYDYFTSRHLIGSFVRLYEEQLEVIKIFCVFNKTRLIGIIKINKNTNNQITTAATYAHEFSIVIFLRSFSGQTFISRLTVITGFKYSFKVRVTLNKNSAVG